MYLQNNDCYNINTGDADLSKLCPKTGPAIGTVINSLTKISSRQTENLYCHKHFSKAVQRTLAYYYDDNGFSIPKALFYPATQKEFQHLSAYMSFICCFPFFTVSLVQAYIRYNESQALLATHIWWHLYGCKRLCLLHLKQLYDN